MTEAVGSQDAAEAEELDVSSGEEDPSNSTGEAPCSGQGERGQEHCVPALTLQELSWSWDAFLGTGDVRWTKRCYRSLVAPELGGTLKR